MAKGIQKVSKQAQTLIQIQPILKICLIQRLSEVKALELFEKYGIKISHATYYKYIKQYRDTIGDRFITLMRYNWAEEHLLVLDIMKEVEAKYWECYYECDNPIDAKHILDSVRAMQGEKLMIYNDSAFLNRMKEIFEERLKEVQEGKIPRLELNKSET